MFSSVNLPLPAVTACNHGDNKGMCFKASAGQSQASLGHVKKVSMYIMYTLYKFQCSPYIMCEHLTNYSFSNKAHAYILPHTN